MAEPTRIPRTFRLPEAALVTLSTEAQRHGTTRTDIVARGIVLAVEELNAKESEPTKPNN